MNINIHFLKSNYLQRKLIKMDLQFVNDDVLYEIVKYLDYTSFINLSVFRNLTDTRRWQFILAQVYPLLYKELKPVDESNESDSALVIYYFYKDNIHNFKQIYNYKISCMDDLSEFELYFNEELNEYPVLIKLLLYHSFPGTYHRFIGLIPETNFRYLPLEPMKVNNLKGLIHSLTFSSRAWVLDYLVYGKLYHCEYGVIQNFLVTHCDDQYIIDNYDDYQINPPTRSFREIIAPAGYWNMYLLDNFIFLWLYYSDPNTDIDCNPYFTTDSLFVLCETALLLGQNVKSVTCKNKNLSEDHIMETYKRLKPDVQFSRDEITGNLRS